MEASAGILLCLGARKGTEIEAIDGCVGGGTEACNRSKAAQMEDEQ